MRLSWLFGLLLVSPFSPSQVTGTFSLEKLTFAPGEPVFLSLTLHNKGKGPVEIHTADPYSFCSDYNIRVTRDAAPEPSCSQGFLGSCFSGAISLASGASRIERILLNYKNTSLPDLQSPVSLPGNYIVKASRDLAFAPLSGTSRIFTAPDHSEVHQTFHLRVDKALKLSPRAYDPYVQQLKSKNDELRREAARTLATLAPPSLEPLLLTFATSRDQVVKQFAPLALANLATKASLAALAGMLLSTSPGSYEYMAATEELGKTHDPAWLPLLLKVADQHGAMYLSYAAENGGVAAIPFLVARLQSHDANTRDAAIYALGHTGSRAAVPILIDLLESHADQQTKDRAITANVALSQLTHVDAEEGPGGNAIPSWQSRWQNWWRTSGASAPIYRTSDCAENTKLP